MTTYLYFLPPSVPNELLSSPSSSTNVIDLLHSPLLTILRSPTRKNRIRSGTLANSPRSSLPTRPSLLYHFLPHVETPSLLCLHSILPPLPRLFPSEDGGGVVGSVLSHLRLLRFHLSLLNTSRPYAPKRSPSLLLDVRPRV